MGVNLASILGMNGNNITWNGVDISWAYGRLLPFIQKHTHCSQRSLDILHDAFIRFTMSLNPNRNHNPHGYLRVIVQNLIIDAFHSNHRYESFDDAHYVDQLTSTDIPSAEYLLDVKQRLIYVQNIVEMLPKRCREVFWLYRIEGYTQAEIAQILGVSKNMVERHVMRAIVDLSHAKEWILTE